MGRDNSPGERQRQQFEEEHSPLYRNDVIQRLKAHIAGCEKGTGGIYERTRLRLATATDRAQKLAERHNAYSAPEPYTAIAEWVTLLSTLRR